MDNLSECGVRSQTVVNFTHAVKICFLVSTLHPLQCQYYQPPSICVSAAGITQDEFLLKMEENDFDRVIQVNLKVSPAYSSFLSLPPFLFFCFKYCPCWDLLCSSATIV